MNFSATIDRWSNKALADFDRTRKAIILELFSSVILDTPVEEGRLRGNWQISSAPVSGELEVTDPSGAQTIMKVEDHLRTGVARQDTVTFLTNNLPYAYRIEFDGWSHTKAPEGMVRKNFIRISENLKRSNGR